MKTAMNEVLNERLQALRKELRREHLSAFIFPGTDPHGSEYVPDRWKGREWISGFDGSAGTAVVTINSAALWTDSRYFIAAAQKLEGTEFELMKQKVPGTPTIARWLGKELSSSKEKEVGIDGSVVSYNDVCRLKTELKHSGGLLLRTNFDPLDRIWTDRPKVPQGMVRLHDLCYAGESSKDKLRRVKKALLAEHADGTVVSALDDIAWLLNLRGRDVACNPVFVSYLLITARKTILFIDERKLPKNVLTYLNEIDVEVKPYGKITKALSKYPDYSILVDGERLNYQLSTAVRCGQIIYAASPIPALKAVKNDTEIRGFKAAMLRDGVAMVKFLHWLKPAVNKGGETELSASEKLSCFRSEQELYCGPSFDTIAAYGEHGAIVHYEPTEETDIRLEPKGFFLLDSGGQYLDGTTDITRTIPLGPLTDEERHVYTLVLKGHIRLEMAKFPFGAAGTQIDCLAREPLWREGMNYLHGTGHGVGAFLNVHEGPHQIRMEWIGAPLIPGMTVTDEPGIYIEGRFGVRIENTLLVKEYMKTDFGEFLQMESLTLCPIDTAPIVREMLDSEEIAWLNDYHKTVFTALAPLLPEAERAWLKANTRPI